MQATNIRIHIQWVEPFFPGGMIFVTYLHLAPILRMSGKMPPLPQYVFYGVDRENLQFLFIFFTNFYEAFSSSRTISMLS